ncbi:MAG TPA: CHC2 zinc finger domain-containing protein [Candidatus Saccharimonadales bacterium]|nr:CHC2 zinc finger domain-containing protein [Candidatus Saccharimonadales bacterium]
MAAQRHFLTDSRQRELINLIPQWQIQEWRGLGWPVILEHFGRRLEELGSGDAKRPTPGSNRMVMHCCFHAERTPSLALYDNGGFTCYGCGCSGGIPEFVMAIEGLHEYLVVEMFFQRLMRRPGPDQIRLFVT